MILIIILLLTAFQVLAVGSEIYYERDWPRNTWKGLLVVIALLYFGCSAFGQATRVDPLQVQTIGNAPPSGYPQVFAIPNATITLCGFPANGTPCTNFAPSYTNYLENVPCPQGSNVVLNGTSACTSTADGGGNFGFWVSPGNYSYMVTTPQGQTYGPFYFSAGNTSSFVSSPIVYANACGTETPPAWCAGSDWAAWVSAADIYLGGNPGTIIFEPSGPAPLVATTQPVLSHANRTLYLRTGTYELNKSGRPGGALLIEASGVTVEGDGQGKSVLLMGPQSQDDTVRAYSGTYPGATGPLYDISVHDLEVHGNCSGTTKGPDDTYQNGINLNNINRTRVFNNYVHDVCFQGIIFDGAGLVFAGTETVNTNGTTVTCPTCSGLNAFDTTPGGWNFRPVRINGTYYTISSVSSGSTLILTSSAGVQNGVNAQFWVGYGNTGNNNIVRNFGEVGIGLEVAQTDTQIVDNTIEDATENNAVGIFLGGYAHSTFLDVTHSLISGNIIRNIPGTGVGIALFDRTSYPLIVGNKFDLMNSCIASTEVTSDSPVVSIKDNICSNTFSTAISLSALSQTVAGFYDIVGNKIFNSGSSGIAIQNFANAVIDENQISVAALDGIRIVGNSANTVVTGNTVLSAANYGVDNVAGNTHTFISGNTLLNNSSTINDLGTNTLVGINNTGSPTPTLSTLTVTNTLTAQSVFQMHLPMFFNAAISIASGFGTSPVIFYPNGTSTFTVTVGTGGTASTGVVTLPAAVDDWNCSANNVSSMSPSVFITKQTAASSTSATFTNFTSSGTAGPWTAGDVLSISCTAF